MTHVAPRIVNNVSFVSRINHEIHFSWQAQYLVKCKCRLRGGLRTDGFMVGSCSDHARIGRALEMTFHPFSVNFFEIRDGHFSWQAQYLVSLDYDACCSAHCK